MRWIAITLAVAGCDVDLERMIDQPRHESYEICEICPGGTVMQAPPEGTIPREAPTGAPEILTGISAGDWVDRVPIDVDRAVLSRGRNRFEIFCASCHGPLGDGRSVVAADMLLRPPPSLVTPPVSEYPPGRIFLVIETGWGLMPSHAAVLDVADRWAVVAYLEALERRQIHLRELPPELSRRAERSLP